MKKILSLLVLLFSFTLGFSESAKPVSNLTIYRNVANIDIEGSTYYNAVVKMKVGGFFGSHVHVTVKDSEGNKIYKHRFGDSYLYIFSNGQIQIGKPSFDRMVIYRNESGDYYTAKVRDEEGIY